MLPDRWHSKSKNVFCFSWQHQPYCTISLCSLFFNGRNTNSIWVSRFSAINKDCVYQNLIGIIIIIVTTIERVYVEYYANINCDFIDWFKAYIDRRMYTYMWSQMSNDVHPMLCLMMSNSSRKLCGGLHKMHFSSVCVCWV